MGDSSDGSDGGGVMFGRSGLGFDTATGHRAAATFALGLVAAAVASLGGVLALDLLPMRVAPVFLLDRLPEASWPAPWLPSALSAAQQQDAAAEQWLHVILVFGAITVAAAAANAVIGLWSHGNERRYETAVRGIAGAPRRRLQARLLRAALVNAALGALAGVPAGVLAGLAMQREWQAHDIVRSTPSAWVLLAVSACVLLAVLAAHITGARLRRPGWLGDALAPGARSVSGWGAEDLRALLGAAQLACAVALTTVSLLVWGYASDLQQSGAAASAGIHDIAVTRVSLPAGTPEAERRRAYASIRAQLLAAGAVSESIASPGALLGIGNVDKVVAECGACTRAGMLMPVFPVAAQQHVVSSGFFRVAGIALTSGRDFDGSEADARSVIVNDSFARSVFQGQDAIGRRIMIGGFSGEWFRVIGTVADVRTVGLHYLEPEPGALEAPARPGLPPAIYFSTATYTPATFDVVVRTPAGKAQLAGFSFEPLARILARANAPQQAFARALTLLGILLCGAAAVGTFTMTTLDVRARRAELAVRRASGARRRDIWRLICGRLALNTLRGTMAGLLLSLALGRVLELFVPGLPVLQPRTALATGGLFAAVVLAAAFVPVRAALRDAIAGAQT